MMCFGVCIIVKYHKKQHSLRVFCEYKNVFFTKLFKCIELTHRLHLQCWFWWIDFFCILKKVWEKLKRNWRLLLKKGYVLLWLNFFLIQRQVLFVTNKTTLNKIASIVCYIIFSINCVVIFVKGWFNKIKLLFTLIGWCVIKSWLIDKFMDILACNVVNVVLVANSFM